MIEIKWIDRSGIFLLPYVMPLSNNTLMDSVFVKLDFGLDNNKTFI